MRSVARVLGLLALLFGTIESAAWSADPETDMGSITSCTLDQMKVIDILEVSWSDEVAICKIIERSLRRKPSVAVLRNVVRIVSVMQFKGSHATLQDDTYQLMNIIEVRGQTGDNQKIISTINLVFPIFETTDGHVTPRDLNIELRASGAAARNFDDMMISVMATMIRQEKKGRGE